MSNVLYYRINGDLVPIDLDRKPMFTIKECDNDYPFWKVGLVYSDRKDWRDDIILLSRVTREEAVKELDRINERLAQMNLIL